MNAPTNPPQRPLALLASLPEGDAAALIERLPTSVIRQLVSILPPKPEVACELPHQLTDALARQAPQGAAESIRAHDNGQAPRLNRLRVNATEILATADVAALARLIEAELPQTGAVVLRMIPLPRAAHVLARLSTPHQLAVARRLAALASLDPVAVGQLRQAVVERVVNSGARPLQPTSGVITVARLLNQLDRATERALMENLAQEDPQLAERIQLVRTVLRRLRQTRFVAGHARANAA